jgi:hypothetical protein
VVDVVLGGSVVLVVDGNVVVVVGGRLVVVTVDGGTVVVVLHGQLATTPGVSTATFRQTRASVATAGTVPFGAQMHSGVQVSRPTAARNM